MEVTMPIEINGVKLYTPQETAKKLKTTPNMLAYWRREGRIESITIGGNNYFTEEQIANADTTPRTRGRRKLDKEDEDERSQWTLMHSTAHEFGAA